jgi:hypothetical protein
MVKKIKPVAKRSNKAKKPQGKKDLAKAQTLVGRNLLRSPFA